MNKKMFKIRNEKGFSLIEVMIGMTILTIAIVAATSILISLINSNKNITRTLQAYNLAQEGIEAVRNIRDTNWLNNLNYLGDVDSTKTIWEKLEVNHDYAIFLNLNPNFNPVIGPSSPPTSLLQAASWSVFLDPSSDDTKICMKNGYFSDCENCVGGGCTPTDFSRTISIKEYCDATLVGNEDLCPNPPVPGSSKAIIVTSTVKFGNKEISLDTVLTDWKTNPL